MAELGKPDRSYSAPSVENVNCENPRGKPVLQPTGPNWAYRGGFAVFSSALHRRSVSCTGCTQLDSRSGLHETCPRVQSRNRVWRRAYCVRSAKRAWDSAPRL